jgi:excisionase family DNA binding protein
VSARDQLTPREVAERTGFSYHAVLRAIRRGDLVAYEPVRGHYRIEIDDDERWRKTPSRSTPSQHAVARRSGRQARERLRPRSDRPTGPGSPDRLEAIEREAEEP